MPYLNDEAIVLNSFRSREKDKLALLMTRNHGLVRAVARRAFSPTSKLGTALEMLSSLKVQLFRRGEDVEIFTLCQATLLERSPLLEADYETLSCGSFLADVISNIATAEHDESDLFQLLVQARASLGKDVDRPLLAVAFLAAVVSDLGVAPQLEACVRCGKEVSQDAHWRFFPVSGGISCDICVIEGESSMAVSPATLGWLQGALAGSLQDSLRRPSDSKTVQEAAGILSAQMESHLGVKFGTLRFIVKQCNP